MTGAPAAGGAGGQDRAGRERLVVVPDMAATLVSGLAPALLVNAVDGVAEQVSTTVSAAAEAVDEAGTAAGAGAVDGAGAVGLPAPAFSEGNAK